MDERQTYLREMSKRPKNGKLGRTVTQDIDDQLARHKEVRGGAK